MQPRGTVTTVAMDMERSDNVKYSLTDLHTLTFEKPDVDTFRCLPLCFNAINAGGLAPTAVNSANEEAVRLFLEGKIKFLQIAELVEKALVSVNNKKDISLEDILQTDLDARNLVKSSI